MIGNPVVVKKEEAQAEETFSVSVINNSGASTTVLNTLNLGAGEFILYGLPIGAGQTVSATKKAGDLLVFPSTSASTVSGDGVRYRKDSDTLTVIFTKKTDAITIT